MKPSVTKQPQRRLWTRAGTGIYGLVMENLQIYEVWRVAS